MMLATLLAILIVLMNIALGGKVSALLRDVVSPIDAAGGKLGAIVTQSGYFTTRAQLEAKGMRLSVTEAGLDWLVERGHQPEFGARPLRRVISRELDTRLARMVLAGETAAGDEVTVDADDGQLRLSVGQVWRPVAGGRHAAPGENSPLPAQRSGAFG